ncbi:MAG: hypothetical protein ACREH6_15830, partial [Geminicoccaceae bacterium]
MPLPRACLALLLVLLVSCFDHNDNFSQHPGFAEWYAAHPPSEALPGADDRALLTRYQPRIFLSAGANGPIDFYRDYIAHGRLYEGAGRLISAEVTREILNRHKHDPHVEFEHEASGAPVHRVIYGRIDRDQLRLPGCEHPLPVTFLTYNLVFRSSGVPAGLPGWQDALLGLFIDLDDWHQLDHYTALSLALWHGAEGGLAPFAVTFQQHNYLRTYLLGDADRPGHLALPPDGRLA